MTYKFSFFLQYVLLENSNLGPEMIAVNLVHRIVKLQIMVSPNVDATLGSTELPKILKSCLAHVSFAYFDSNVFIRVIFPTGFNFLTNSELVLKYVLSSKYTFLVITSDRAFYMYMGEIFRFFYSDKLKLHTRISKWKIIEYEQIKKLIYFSTEIAISYHLIMVAAFAPVESIRRKTEFIIHFLVK